MKNENFEIEINGKKVETKPGEMLIEAADRAGVYIPRFCYHKKLKIAANCRMCLVEVENVPKTLPACATPVTPGMKALTKSEKTIKSQQAVMEFLLANHPLDCPICDQGGECELQDLAMGYGTDKSRFSQDKRAVKDEDLGPLVSTEMTRCIHCTRCVRFCEDIAGNQQLGAFGRGGDMNIGTFLKAGLVSELSANVVDLCPVGALTSKPFRYSGRSWEFEQHESLSPHDCVGSNMYFHSFADNYGSKAQVMRVLPKENEAVNEIWLADRDRFSYTSLSSDDRVTEPMLKRNGKWEQVSWESVLNFLVDNIKSIMDSGQAEKIGGLISSSSSCEEMYLLQKLLRSIGSDNIDHRTSVTSFSDQDCFSTFPGLVKPIKSLEQASSILLIGSFAREEQPLLFHRIRQAVAKGAKLFVLNSYDYDFACDIKIKKIIAPQDLLKAVVALNKILDPTSSLANVSDDFLTDSDLKAIIESFLQESGSIAVIAGEQLESHNDASQIRSWLYKLCSLLNDADLHHLTKGANTAGAWLAGAIPHRHELTVPTPNPGLNAEEMLRAKLPVYFLHGLEASYDFIEPTLAISAFQEADLVVSLNTFVSQEVYDYADIILPLAAHSEYAGSFINCEGVLQRFNSAVLPLGQSKPGWKIYKVLAQLLGFDNFDFKHCSEITNILEFSCKSMNNNSYWSVREPIYMDSTKTYRIGHWPASRIDPYVRRAIPLQNIMPETVNHARISPQFAEKHGINDREKVLLSQNEQDRAYTCTIDPAMSENAIWLSSGLSTQHNLGCGSGEIRFVEVVR